MSEDCSRGWKVGRRQNTILDSSTLAWRLGQSYNVPSMCPPTTSHIEPVCKLQKILHFSPRKTLCIDNTRLPLDIIILKYPLTIGHLDLPRYESFTSPLRDSQLYHPVEKKRIKADTFILFLPAGKKFELPKKNRLKLKSFNKNHNPNLNPDSPELSDKNLDFAYSTCTENFKR